MGTVRVLVGTRKGAFILSSDGVRNDWNIDGPHFGVGRSTTSRAPASIPIACMQPRARDGSGNWCRNRTTVEKAGIR